jgi:hypothetical protein
MLSVRARVVGSVAIVVTYFRACCAANATICFCSRKINGGVPFVAGFLRHPWNQYVQIDPCSRSRERSSLNREVTRANVARQLATYRGAAGPTSG